MDKTEYDILLKSVRKLGRQVNGVEGAITRVEEDLANDRKDIDVMRLELVAVKEGNTSIINTLTRFQKKIGDVMREGIDSGLRPMERKIDDWVEKKVIRTRSKKRNLIEWVKDYIDGLADWKKGVEEDGGRSTNKRR